MSFDTMTGRLSLPVIAAPMFLASGPELVIAACRGGIVGAFPALNQRSTAGYEDWLNRIEAALAEPSVTAVGPHAVNLIVHKTNTRLAADLDVTVRHKVPIVITSLGAAREVVDAVHAYGGKVFHDVISIRQAEKAIGAGVDGIIAVCGGAGGHAGTLNPFAFLQELRAMTDRTLILAGAITTGGHVAAAIAAGADLVSVGTRFIATQECAAVAGYKDMLVSSTASDIVYTAKISGVNANFMIPSLQANGIKLATHSHEGPIDMDAELSGESKAWRDIWSAGQGVGGIRDIPSVAELLQRLKGEYADASQRITRRAAA